MSSHTTLVRTLPTTHHNTAEERSISIKVLIKSRCSQTPIEALTVTVWCESQPDQIKITAHIHVQPDPVSIHPDQKRKRLVCTSKRRQPAAAFSCCVHC